MQVHFKEREKSMSNDENKKKTRKKKQWQPMFFNQSNV
jgi:hypothetical protein